MMVAITQKLKEEMAPALHKFTEAQMPIAGAFRRGSGLLSSIALLSIDEARELVPLFQDWWEGAGEAGKSAVVCNLFADLWFMCRDVLKEAERAQAGVCDEHDA